MRLDGFNNDGSEDRFGVAGEASIVVTWPDGHKRHQPISDGEFDEFAEAMGPVLRLLIENVFTGKVK